jgi:hypothetical protein
VERALSACPARPVVVVDGGRQCAGAERHGRFLPLLRREAPRGVPLWLRQADHRGRLPRETEFLARYDRFRARIEDLVDMPERTIDLLFRFLHQNHGTLSTRAREEEFASLRQEELVRVERAYREIFQPAV